MSIISKYIIFLLILYLKFSLKQRNLKRNLKRHPEDIFFFNKTYIESHRGLNKMVCENTLESFQKALEYNLESIETDVWLTKDNVAVICHGHGESGSIDDIYDHPGNITNLTWEELSTYRTIEGGLKMPRLRDVFKLLKNKMFINVEIKDPRIDIVFPFITQLIEEFDMFSQIYLTSLHYGYYEKNKEYNKKYNKILIFGFVYEKYQQYAFDFFKSGSILSIYWADATKSVCDIAHMNNMAVLAWFDKRDKETTIIYQQLIENGADIICCNDPILATKYLKYYEKNHHTF